MLVHSITWYEEPPPPPQWCGQDFMYFIDMDCFLLLERNIEYNKIHWHGKFLVMVGCKQVGRLRELIDYKISLIHALKVNSPQAIILHHTWCAKSYRVTQPYFSPIQRATCLYTNHTKHKPFDPKIQPLY